MPYFAVLINLTKMQTIQANNYPIHFNEKAYEALNLHLKENKYSNLFIIVDSDTNTLLPTSISSLFRNRSYY